MPSRAAAIPALLLAACTYRGMDDPAPLPPLSNDPQRPALALLEHVLTGYFAEAGAVAPTTCATFGPTPLTADEEQALIVRLVRLAPAARCVTRGSEVFDAMTGEAAQQVQVYEFACAGASLCRAWVAQPGGPARRYTLRFENGAWRFDSDSRLVGE